MRNRQFRSAALGMIPRMSQIGRPTAGPTWMLDSEAEKNANINSESE